MKNEELNQRVDDLEKRVAALDDEKRKWDKERETILKENKAYSKFKEALLEVLPAIPSTATSPASSSKTVNLEHQELVVNVTHVDKPVNMTTSTVNGKVLFCATTELSKDGFTEADLSNTLKAYGWNIGHSTLAPTLGGLVRDGYLIKVEGTRPMRYRLPTKVEINITRE